MTKKKTPRQTNDAYYTPEWVTRALLKHEPIQGKVLEPCCGDGAIARVLRPQPGIEVTQSDITMADIFMPRDATTDQFWNWYQGYDWVVTNPPFSVAHEIVPRAFESARVGIAMLLRLSYLEPAKGRGEWLESHTLSHQIVVGPRIKFAGKGCDTITVAWLIWRKDGTFTPSNFVNRVRFLADLAA